MTTQGISGEQDYVGRKDESSHSNAERLPACSGVDEPQRLVYVVEQHEQKDECDVQEVAVNVLYDQRKGGLAAVLFPGLAHGAGRGIGPEGLVIRPAVVVAGQPEEPGEWQDEESGREYQPTGPPLGLGSEPDVGGAPEQF